MLCVEQGICLAPDRHIGVFKRCGLPVLSLDKCGFSSRFEVSCKVLSFFFFLTRFSFIRKILGVSVF